MWSAGQLVDHTARLYKLFTLST